jgi:hypothetical protein
MAKRNANDPLILVRTRIRATDILSQIGNLDMIYSQWWIPIRWSIANVITGKAKRLHRS